MNRDRQTTLAVGVVTLLALVVRLVSLGARVAHQDEARVAYWAYRYMENGVYWYRPVVHGPFIAIVDSWVFALIGAAVARKFTKMPASISRLRMSSSTSSAFQPLYAPHVPSGIV